MPTRSLSRSFLWILPLLLSTLACRYATRMILPDTPTPVPPTLTLTATLEPTVVPPTATPHFEAACPALLSDILDTATMDETETRLRLSRRNEADEQDFRYLVTYTLEDDKLASRDDVFVPGNFEKELDERASHEQIWNLFSAIIPLQERDFVTEFSAMSDGRGSILGGVSRTYENPVQWRLRIDILDAADPNSLMYTLLHEFGHLLTLNSSQVVLDHGVYLNPDNNEHYETAVAECPQYFIGDGCSRSDSYINEFFVRHWSTFHAEWQEIDQQKGESSYYDSLHAFYKIYADQFLTEYSAKSPEEDIAESLAFFILAPKPEPASIADEKILFFYEYPELVQLRQDILTRLCDEFPQ